MQKGAVPASEYWQWHAGKPRTNSMKQSLVVLLAAAALALGWFFVSPLFIDEAVDEGFDFVQEGGGVDMDAVMAMPAAKRLAMKDEIMTAAAAAPDAASMEAMPASAPTVIASGQFVDADAIHKGSGMASVYSLPDDRHVVRFEDFRVTNGPALVVYLAKHASPTKAADVSDNGFLKLGKLKGNVGNQNYVIPEGTDVSEYKSVVIWCELFSVLFSPAALTTT